MARIKYNVTTDDCGICFRMSNNSDNRLDNRHTNDGMSYSNSTCQHERTCRGREAHVGGLHRGRQQGKDFIPGSLSVAIQVDGHLDLVRTDLAGNITD